MNIELILEITLLHYNIDRIYFLKFITYWRIGFKDNEIKEAGDNKEEVITEVRMLSQSKK